MESADEGDGPDILDSPRAGARVIQGTAVRSAGYFAGMALAVLAAPLLTRHLGVTDYGSFVVVSSLIVIATIFADAGMTAAGIREYSARSTADRSLIIQNLVFMRFAASAAAGAGAVVFAIVAGYDPLLVAGAALGAVGLVLTIAQRTYAIPLAVALRLELFTALDLLRQTLTVAGIIVLVVAGAGLLAFFVLPIPVALVALVATLLVVKGDGRIRPTVRREEFLLLLGQVPAAVASMVGALFYRVAIIMMSLLATSQQTGYFGLSLQVVDVFIPVATLVAGSAFPILARAADTDHRRLGFAFRQLFDVCVILGIGTAFLLSLRCAADRRVSRRCRVRANRSRASHPGTCARGDVPGDALRVHALGRPSSAAAHRRQSLRARRRGHPYGLAHPYLGGERSRGGDGHRREPVGGVARRRASQPSCGLAPPAPNDCEGDRCGRSSRVLRANAHPASRQHDPGSRGLSRGTPAPASYSG